MKRTLTISFTALVIVVLVMAFGPLLTRNQGDTNGNKIGLRPPSLLQTAKASTDGINLSQKLDAEAGISAYYFSAGGIDLSLAKTAFRTTELQTADYLIGSVPVPNHPENFDAHVYVNKNGWILAYYLNTDPTSKMLDVKTRTIATTKLTSVIAAVASPASIPFAPGSETYYDFRYPNANNLLFVAEDFVNGNEFTITMPGTYGYSDRGWAVYDKVGDNVFKVDNVAQKAIWEGSYMYYGSLTASQMLPDVAHSIAVDSTVSDNAYGILVITYRVP